MNTTENNKIIAEFIKKYTVDEYGNIFNKKGFKLKTTITKNGYERFNTSRPTKSYLVHRLVAYLYLDNIDGKEQINHKDGNKLNNHKDNLEWITASENIIHGFNNGLISKDKNNKGKNHYRSIAIVAKNSYGETVHSFESAGEAERLSGFNSRCIRQAINGRLKTYKNLYWHNEQKSA